jgi:uncharacterized protein (TIGR02145 family)
MKTIHLFLLSALAFFVCAGLQAQVSIGSTSDDPKTGALLDLNTPTGNKGGLLLSNVSIADLSKIPTGINLFPGITSTNNDTNTAFTGAMVYHTGENDIPAGVYVWNGGRWIPAGGCKTCPAGTVADDDCNCYTIGDFDGAGIWMTQNLRTEGKTYDFNDAPIELNPNTGTGSATAPQFTYPGSNNIANERETEFKNSKHEHYGLLYNWAAASGRTDNLNVDETTGYDENTPPSTTTQYRGVCPKGWHLPNDYEWCQLEKEIAEHPDKYSEQQTSYTGDYTSFYTMSIWRPGDMNGQDDTYLGRQMKSKTPVSSTTPGSSFPREAGGFDALLVGLVAGSGTASDYGTDAIFWSSSSYSSTQGVDRYLRNGYTGMYRGHDARSYLFSVRCKKD